MTKKHYLTEEGLEKVKNELKELIQEKKKKTKDGVPEVLHSEDLNPEYLDFRQDLRLLERRIMKLDEVVKNAEIIKSPENKRKVELGARVIIEADGQEDQFTIVGSLEADPAEGKISNESLVGRKLMGKKVGDKVTVASKVETVYEIKKIEYQDEV